LGCGFDKGPFILVHPPQARQNSSFQNRDSLFLFFSAVAISKSRMPGQVKKNGAAQPQPQPQPQKSDDAGTPHKNIFYFMNSLNCSLQEAQVALAVRV